jgi:hypothetical protein
MERKGSISMATIGGTRAAPGATGSLLRERGGRIAMKNLGILLFALVTGCTGAGVAVDDGLSSSAETEALAAETSDLDPGAPPVTYSTQSETCTVTTLACHVGRCEFLNDTYQYITEVCCTPQGVCETERYKLCGC